MADYLTVPILEELIRRVEEDPRTNDAVKAMTSGILTYYFTIDNGFIVSPKSTESLSTGFEHIIRRIQSDSLAERKIVDHAVVRLEVDDSLQGCVGRLQHSIQNLNTGGKSCWAILVCAQLFYFYEYCGMGLQNECLVPWAPPGQVEEQDGFHKTRMV
ncbi:hypothetical protein AbraIFM66951_001251 [Aspergillus brasiliensis]|uniref:Uncharacterized protein n=1 Tax=Aspergillus brasiliensis TaxID=319629 RepID=A0A9W5YW17_9EURO|nr:hypothetical protein AbraCBS73388_009604 [Aspergillus brasiliensis]GKZ49002.1 hypothetical protein AbraIFM66951_001251 [Aspergillus brasiliensis]